MTLNNASKESTQNQNTPATKTTTTTSVTNAQLKALVEQGIVDALAARDADRNMNGEDNHNSGMGTEGVVELTQWFERMETVFRISNCTMENQVTFATCTLLGIYLTWWNSHVRTVSHDDAYAMTWTELKKKMIDKYCPRGEMKKLEAELWNLKVKGTDVLDYNKRFQELASLCVRMFPEESNKIERYVGGLPDMIHESVVASKPKTMQDAIEMATELMDKKISTFNVAQAYTIGIGKRKEYAGTLPLCNKCKFHQNGPCTVKCANCKIVGHLTRDYWSSAATKNQRTLICYECRNQGHYMSDYLELKNQNHGNQAGCTGTHGMVLAIVGGETDQDPNNNEDEIEA
ncbi:hypothetical protein Tco_1391075 [Tanacetum coccineum]